MMLRARAPLRISFGGGGTDVSPYMDQFGGVVINATLDRYAYASMRRSQDSGISVHSLDFDIYAKYKQQDKLPLDGELDLIKAAINRMNVYADGAITQQGLEFFIHSDAPPGSGLGSSSTMCIALLGLLRHWLNVPITDYQLAEMAFDVERKDLRIAGGRQDQYASLFGGFNFIEFAQDATAVVNPLRVRPETINELQYLCLLCYTGTTRMSDQIIRQQQDGVREQETARIEAMHEVKALAVEMKNALLQARLRDFAALMHEGWEAKKRMAGSISNASIDALYTAARDAGALGGKVTGAGGGGYMLFMCEFDKKQYVAAALQEMGCQVVNFAFDPFGLRTWDVVE